MLVLLMEESGAHKENCCLQLVPDKVLSHKDVLSTLIKGRNQTSELIALIAY